MAASGSLFAREMLAGVNPMAAAPPARRWRPAPTNAFHWRGSSMGRRDIVIVLRGTATCPEWAENLCTGLVPVSDDDDGDDATAARNVPKVVKGFLSLYKTAGDHVPSLSDAFVEEVRRLIEVYKGEELSITVVGHSLGASLALLAADELSACLAADAASNSTAADDHQPPPISVVSFGGPKTDNRAFADRLQHEREMLHGTTMAAAPPARRWRPAPTNAFRWRGSSA